MTAEPPNCNTCGPWWRLPLLLATVLAAIWLMRGQSLQRSERAEGRGPLPAATSIAAGQEVTLTVDFGNGRREQYPSIPWRDGLTVLNVTRESPPENVLLEIRGSGEGAYLASFDGVADEGTGGRGWVYSVNGKVGDRSSAIYVVQPRDQVLWTFKKPQ